MFIDTDQRSAACYASMENLSERMCVLAQLISDVEQVPEMMPVTDTAVVRLQSVRRTLKRQS